MTALARIAQKTAAQQEPGEFAREILAGLNDDPKRLPPKYFYDEIGSRLFERITMQPEYYLTRTELRILNDHADELAQLLPTNSCLVEFGSGSSKKVRLLLRAARNIAAYVPVDISAAFLRAETARLRREFPKLNVVPVEADFTRVFDLPAAVRASPRAGFFPGSTIGNFEQHEACAFLEHAGRMLGTGSVLIIGVDLVKDRSILRAAYNDSAGVTAQFNLNLLARINRELGANFDLDGFEHHAVYRSERHRIEMHLASVRRQKVKVCGETIDFRAGETIHTENSYKYTIQSFTALARGSGWSPVAVWTDADKYFSLHALRLKPEPVPDADKPAP